MTAPKPPDPSSRPPVVFVQRAHDYKIQGKRRWSDLRGSEQDEYILACFAGESARGAAEQRLDLYDRVASSMADELLGPYRQYDINDGLAHYSPDTPERAAQVLWTRIAYLKGTPLGDRLSFARERQHGSHPQEGSYSDDPGLEFEYLDSCCTPGLESLAESATDGLFGIGPYEGRWNDWKALDLHQARDFELARDERWRRLMEQPTAAREPKIQSHDLPVSTGPTSSLTDSETRAVPLWPVVVLALTLSWALVPINPYGYYVLLRWISCPLLAYLAWLLFDRMSSRWTLGIGFLAVLYNPFLPLALGRPMWSVVNVVSLGVLVSVAVLLRRRTKK